MTLDHGIADPFLTANLYCAGRQDEVFRQVLAPWRRALPSGAFLWALRYPRGGEHLKVRVHAEASRVDDAARRAIASALEERFAAWAEGLPPAGSEQPRPHPAAAALPAIDEEDSAAEPRNDRTLLWTTYRRSAVTHGGGPLLADDTYCGLFARAAAAGCERWLAVVQAAEGTPLAFAVRFQALVRHLAAVLGEVAWSPQELTAYLAYHRDWLVRQLAAARPAAARPEAAVERLRKLEAQAAKVGSAPAVADFPGEGSPLAELARHVARFRDQPEYQVDPFAASPVQSAVFKVLHGLANLYGVAMAQEALIHHLLLRRRDPERARTAVALEPG